MSIVDYLAFKLTAAQHMTKIPRWEIFCSVILCETFTTRAELNTGARVQ